MSTIYINGVEQVVIHSFERHTDVTRELFLPACEGYVGAGTPAQAPAGYGSAVSGGANLNEPFVYFTMKVPDDFVSFISFEAIWICGSAAPANMYWVLPAYYASCGQGLSTHSDEPAIGVTATDGADIINCQEPANPLTLTDLALGDFIGIMFRREGTHANDTLDEIVSLLGLLFTYVGHQ